jgi:hypothetical protein
MGGTISYLIKGFDNSAKQLIFQIDPSILKLKNTTLNLVDDFEKKISSNTEEYFLSLRENVFVCFLFVIIFVIIVLILIYNLNDILYYLGINLLIRQYLILFIITIILFWLFIGLICSIFGNFNIDWLILKLILFSLFCIFIILLIFIWFRFILIYKKRIKKKIFIYIFCT